MVTKDTNNVSRKRVFVSKGGRNKLRTVGRHARAKLEEVQKLEEPQKLYNDVKHTTQIDMPSEQDETTDRDQIYGALLTILKSETAPIDDVEEGITEEEIQLPIRHQVEPLEEHINAALGQAEKETESDVEDDELDIPVKQEGWDFFDLHYNTPSESFAKQVDDMFSNRTVKYQLKKFKGKPNEELLLSVPCNDEIEWPYEPPKNSKQDKIHSYHVKQKLKIQNNILDENTDTLTGIQNMLLSPMFQYRDILYNYTHYEIEEDQYRDLYALHILNHVMKTRDRILKNNQRLHDDPDLECLDQGFTRPKVLIVVPTRDTAYSVVSKIIAKSGIDQVDKRSKFNDQFYDTSLPPSSKPKSFRHVFKGNTNDYFVLAMKFTRKAIKLYSNFYQSDVIICSPLGIQMILENTDKKKRQDDFLSSIEIMIIDQLHSLEYQNIQHLYTVFDHINKIPQEQHDADFSRIRMWSINDQAKRFRQTMLFTKYVSPVANHIINGKCSNWAGKWKNHLIVNPTRSAINHTGLPIKQIFQRIDLPLGGIIEEPDYRFKYFTGVTLSNLLLATGSEDGVLIYITDYTDYVRIRNYMKDKTPLMFGEANEYSGQRQLTQSRALFQEGRLKVLLYTERLHHFRRYDIKGVKSVVFYKPPTNPEFYTELVRSIGKTAFLGKTDLNVSRVRSLYTKLDSLALERIVGTDRVGVLIHGQNELYEFK